MRYLPVICLGMLAAAPVWAYGAPQLVDAPNHFYRIAELAWHLRHFDFYPRWLADVHYGFGAPVLNFYAPLSYYLPAVLFVAGIPLPLAFANSFVLAMVAGTCGAYVWLYDEFESHGAALVAAGVYALAPYMYYNISIRGAYPETWALAILPWLFWITRRFAKGFERSNFVILTLLYAALVLTHNLSSLLFTPLLFFYFLAQHTSQSPSWRWSVASLTIALGLTAFYLVPFIFEASDVNLGRASLDYRQNFLALTDLVTLPRAFDPLRVQYPFARALSPVALAVAGVGVATYLLHPSARPKLGARGILTMLGLFFLCAVLTLNITEPLWDLSPLARLIQFPHRLLGAATFLLAWLTGLGMRILETRWRPLPYAVLGGLIVFSWAWTFQRPYATSYPAQPTPLETIQYELAHPLAVGTTYQQEFLPRTVTQLPAADSLLSAYQTSLIPNRFSALPSYVNPLAATQTLTSDELTYTSAQSFTLTVQRFYFPFWAGTLDDQAMTLRPDTPSGLITVPLPAGTHTLKLFLRATPAQWLGSSISLFSALGLLLIVRRSPKSW